MSLVLICILFSGFKITSEDIIPIFFSELGVEIRSIPSFDDTVKYNKSSKEDFKFIFLDFKGKCYCERYLNGKLYQKGNFESSIDTLKRYVSGRDLTGKLSSIKVQRYFEPLKNGEWVTYKNGKEIKEVYILGIRQTTAH